MVCSAILPSDWLSEACPNDAYVEELVSRHKDQLLQDPLTFKPNSSYELFCFYGLPYTIWQAIL